jgi:hypothetical protein
MSGFETSWDDADGSIHEEDGATVALSAPDLAELLAASGEGPALSAFAVDVETTVVIPGQRPPTSTTAPVAWTPPMATVATSSARTNTSRLASMGWLAAAGLVFGVLVATSLGSASAVLPAASFAGGASARAVHKHEGLTERTTLVSPAHAKVPAATKRLRRPAVGSVKATPPPRPTEVAADVSQQLSEDRQLVLAAQLERSL